MYISMSNGYDINNSTNAVFPFTFIFKSDDESRGFFFFTRICVTLLLQHYLKDKKELLIV